MVFIAASAVRMVRAKKVIFRPFDELFEKKKTTLLIYSLEKVWSDFNRILIRFSNKWFREFE